MKSAACSSPAVPAVCRLLLQSLSVHTPRSALVSGAPVQLVTESLIPFVGRPNITRDRSTRPSAESQSNSGTEHTSGCAHRAVRSFQL
ncbi:hypothetical protein FA95DRAFT_1567722 [Auriscalpium vulgare]|uniref:Uncharacterized protein n=1 Tax=Auriscalpium vulgare TaxID=40419 RepID=A0ACB8R3K9_9AGAM|nr:hypothetical protein FA95DRAFT_1567722 [Auriscalpium vulgare]